MKAINLFKRKYLQSKELKGFENFEFSTEEKQILNLNKNLFDQISNKHKSYVTSISSPEMAMSLELANFIFSYCLVKKPLNLIDLGSGFSSFLFRFYKKNVDNDVNVFSIDDSADWLIKTKDYLAENELNTESLFTLDELLSQHLKNKFDFVLLDLNFVEVRKKYIEFAYNILVENGILIIDDTHKVEFLRDVKSFFNSQNKKLINLKSHTYDSFLRFATAIIK